uniref:Coiled-coil SMC6 And NSE5 INteracting (CANIN) domain-containing protein n=1 Tax=Esox lucius TaxID=8010 RepID=A0A3P9AJL9_ESOLU
MEITQETDQFPNYLQKAVVKDIIPLGSPRIKQPLAPPSLQEAPINTSEPLGCMSDLNTHPFPKRALPMDQLRAKPSPDPSGVHNRTSGGASDAKPSSHPHHSSGVHNRTSGGTSDAKPSSHPPPPHISGVHNRTSGGASDAKPSSHPHHSSGVHNRTSGGASDAKPSSHPHPPHTSGVNNRTSGGASDAKPSSHPHHSSGVHNRTSGGTSDAKPSSHPPPPHTSGVHRRASGSVSDAKPRPQPPHSSGLDHRASGGVSDIKSSTHPPHPSGVHNRTSGGGARSDTKPSPRPPHWSGVHHTTSGGGARKDAKPGLAIFTNTHNGRMQPSHKPQSSSQSPVSPNSCKALAFRPRDSVDYGGLPNEQMNRDLKVGSPKPQFIGYQPRKFSPPSTPTSTRPAQSSHPPPSNMDPHSPGKTPAEHRHYSQKLSHSLHSTSQHKAGGNGKEANEVPNEKSHGFMDQGGPNPSNRCYTPVGKRSLSLKKRRPSDSRREDTDNKRLRSEMYTSNTALSHTSHPTYGTASSKMSPDPKVPCLKRVFMKDNLKSSPTLRLMDHRSLTTETEPRTVSNFPLTTAKPARRLFTCEGQVPSRNPVVVIRNPDPRSGNCCNPSRHTVKMPVQCTSRGEGRQQESRREKCQPNKETPGPISRSKILASNEIPSYRVAAAEHRKQLLDPKINSVAFVRLESCQTQLTKLETDSCRKATASSASSPSEERSLKVDVASGLTVAPAIPKVRHVVEESGKAGAGLQSSGFASAGFGSQRDENANVNTELSGQTAPLSASATPSSRFMGGLFSMETLVLNTSPCTPHRSPSPASALDREGKDEVRKEGQQKPRKCLSFIEKDPLDVELGLDLDLSLGLEFELSQESSSSEEDQLPSLQQILDRTARPPDTPVKGTYPSPNTPVGPRHHSQPPESYKTKPTSYKNNLDEMLKENKSIQRSKDVQTKLRLACEENLLRLAEEEEEKSTEEAISHEHKEFLQRFSVVSGAIRDLHPGEAVFSLENFGRLFNQHTLKLRNCNVTPRNTAQKTLLWSTPDQFSSQVSSGLFQRAYSSSPCPPQVTLWLFQMMSVHSDMLICHHVLAALSDIAFTAADHIVLNKGERFEVWVPSVADISLVFMNMGVPFVTLFPLEDLQPPFTEGDLIEGIEISTNRLSTEEHVRTFPEHNFDSVIEYLFLCTSLCPRTYCDRDLLLLMTVMCTVGLDTQLTLLPKEHLRSLLRNLVNSIKDLDNMLPRICRSLIDLTEDHHNLRWLVQLLPDNMRGKQLRRHLSMSAISKLLNNQCTYKSSNAEFQLSDLRRYLPRMRPSSLLHYLANSRSGQNPHRVKEEQEDDCASLDQQAYYLCYSLLSLANEATIFEFFPQKQKRQLLLLSAELEKHIKCDIRESEKMLYRSKVKDFVARIYTKWQVVVHKSRPLQGKLYEYWIPLPEDAMSSSQENQQSIKESEEEMFMEVEGEEEEEEEEEGEGGEEDAKEEKKEKILKMDLALEEEKEILEEKFLKIDDNNDEEEEEEEEEEERMEVALEESDEQPKTEDMEEELAEFEKEETGTDKPKEEVEKRGKQPMETEDGGKIQNESEMDENRRDPREAETETTEQEEDMERKCTELKEKPEKQS